LQKVEASAPAKLILFGEHAVAYGQPALGVALTPRVSVELTSGRGRVRCERAIESELPQNAASIEELVRAALGKRAAHLDLRIRMGVPPGAGLGTSAALGVALLRAHDKLLETDRSARDLLAAAIAIENLAHGASSGLDPAIVIAEAPIQFTLRSNLRTVRPVAVHGPLFLVVGARGTHGGTRHRVRAIGVLAHRAERPVKAAMKTLGEAARAGLAAMRNGDAPALGFAIDLAHGVLGGLGLVGDEIEKLVRAARNAGALGAKMSGAGGDGGALYALAPDLGNARAIERIWKRSGAHAFIETLA
jgi:mevalonate kinase